MRKIYKKNVSALNKLKLLNLRGIYLLHTGLTIPRTIIGTRGEMVNSLFLENELRKRDFLM